MIRRLLQNFAQSKRAQFLLTLVALAAFSPPVLAQGQSEFIPEKALAAFPVQSGGRMKPLDTLARESVRLVTGKKRFQKQDPVMTLLGWWADPETARTQDVIEFRNLEIKKELGLDPDQRWFSLDTLADNKELRKRQGVIHQRLKDEEELQEDEKTVQDLLVKMNVLHMTLDGSLIQAVPNPDGMDSDWGSFADLEHPDALGVVGSAKEAVQALREALKSGDSKNLSAVIIKARAELQKLGPVPEESMISRELRFNDSHPFRTAWLFYLAGLAVLAFVKNGEKRTNGYWAGFSLISAGFLMHVYGFFLRCTIAGRPPVTNMYESVIWVAFGAVFFAFILEAASPKRYYLMAAATGAIVCLILADSLPTVLDPSIRPLTPVLRSNFWLTIHVLSITLGYAGFMLALGLGHIVLWKCALRPEQGQEIDSLHDALYRSLQIGVLLLAAGTILGGVWANYSWGRFWGWDPKEVWALIALLGYLAILHGRHAGWLRKFGIAAWSVIAFQLVLMAWYGVNYVLGAGLHSYGFGTGGGSYVACYVAAEVVFVLWAQWSHKRHLLPPGSRS